MRSVMRVAALAVVFGCSGVSQEQYKAKEAEATKFKQASQEQSDKASALEAKVTSLEQQTATLQQQTASLQQENAALQQQTAGTKQKLTETSAAHAALQQSTPVRVNQQLLFKENSSKLTNESKMALDAVAQAVSGAKDKFVIVSGYTDDTEATKKGAAPGGWQLSSARALEAAKYLSGRGIEATRIAVAGFGQARPVAPNDSIPNRSLNRRVEVILTPLDPNVSTIDVKPAELKHGG